MGYKVRVYAGKVTDTFSKAIFETIAMIDIGELEYESAIFALCKNRNGPVVFLRKGDVEVQEDYYNDPLVAIDIGIVMNALRRDSENYKHNPLLYITFTVLGMIADHYLEPKVVLYGY